jgi:hypothetical protein
MLLSVTVNVTGAAQWTASNGSVHPIPLADVEIRKVGDAPDAEPLAEETCIRAIGFVPAPRPIIQHLLNLLRAVLEKHWFRFAQRNA